VRGIADIFASRPSVEGLNGEKKQSSPPRSRARPSTLIAPAPLPGAVHPLASPRIPHTETKDVDIDTLHKNIRAYCTTTYTSNAVYAVCAPSWGLPLLVQLCNTANNELICSFCFVRSFFVLCSDNAHRPEFSLNVVLRVHYAAEQAFCPP